jgi:hypothetical protein
VLLNAERSFRRLKGHRQMPLPAAALARHIEAATPACDAATSHDAMNKDRHRGSMARGLRLLYKVAL